MQDTLRYVKKLIAVGVPREQAEAQVEIMSNFVDSNFATKEDLKSEVFMLRSDIRQTSTELRGEMKELSAELRGEMQALSTELRGEMKQLSTELRSDMQVMRADLSRELTLKLGGIVVATCTIMLGAMGLLAQYLRP